MKQIAILLDGTIKNDSRVIKTINTISSVHNVDLYYLNGNREDKALFNERVKLFPINYQKTLRTKIISHTKFYNEYMFLADKVLESKNDYDYVWANDLTCLKPAWKVKKTLDCKLVYDSHEIYTETINQFFPQYSKGIKKIIYSSIISYMRKKGIQTESKILKDVDYFITVGEGLKKYFMEKYAYEDEIYLVHNLPRIAKNITPVNLKKVLNLKDDTKLFIYQGTLNSGRGQLEMVKAFSLTDENTCLVFLGKGPLRPNLEKLVDELNIAKKVKFIDAVDSKDMLNYTSGADFGINLLEAFNLSKKMTVPNKLFEYIQTGLPTISSNTSELQKFYNKYKIGVLIENTPDNIAKTVNSIIQEDITEYKNCCKQAALEYNWENQEKTIMDIFKD
ncbi:MAG: hypothetical protein C0596_04790 [Marinilabiliales bacterium]|nr:MAG: hypothetical protein C0596_04790 [Marinilabiliales bacterium]